MRNPSLALVLTMFALSTGGCSPPVVDKTEDGPTFSMSAEERVVEYSVRLCYDGPTGRQVETAARVGASLTIEGGDATTTIFGQSHREDDNPVLDPPRLEDWESAPTDRLDLDEGQSEGFLSFEIDAVELARTGGCLEPRIVRFEIAEGPDELAVDVEWDATLSVEYNRKAPDDDDLSIEIQRITDE